LMTGHFCFQKCTGVTVKYPGREAAMCLFNFPLPPRLCLSTHGGVVVHGEHVELHTREIDVTLAHIRIARSRQISVSTP
jgi:hypothetical protein